MPTPSEPQARRRRRAVLAALLLLSGCGHEPSAREIQNARAFEALLSAITLKNKAELERDAKLIEDRHAAGELSRTRYDALREIIDKARSADWSAAEQRAYAFRAEFGDRGSYFR